MRTSIASEHKNFFCNKGFIEFESLLKPQQLDLIRQHTAQYMQHSKEEDPFLRGVLWQFSLSKHMGWLTRLAGVALELINEAKIRFGCDQIFYPDEQVSLFHGLTLQQFSSIQGVTCGLMLCLKGDSEESCNDQEASECIDIFSVKAGNGVYFSSELKINFNALRNKKDTLYLLVTFTRPNAVYVPQEQDLQSHVFKKLGYAAGDRLNDAWSPLLLSR